MNQQKTTRLAQTQTCEVHPGWFNITCVAQPVSLPMQLRGQRREETSHPLVPCHDKATIQLPCLEDSSSRGSNKRSLQPPLALHALAWRKLPDACMEAQGRGEAGRVHLSLGTLGGQQQPMPLPHQTEVHSCISQAFGTLTIPKKVTKFRQKRCICSAWP